MKFLMMTQVYPPDSAAVGQYFEDLALKLAEIGHFVTVYTADRDYDNPKIIYDNTSRHPSITIHRVPFSSFGKKTILHRLAGQLSFLTQCFFYTAFGRKHDAVIITTIPATTGLMFLILDLIKRLNVLYWVMDVNPDQAIALGAIGKKSPAAKLLAWCNERLIKISESVICLDKEMHDRIFNSNNLTSESAEQSEKSHIIPPWPLERDLCIVNSSENPFVKKFDLINKITFMYSGNHSLVHPLTTLIEALPNALQDPRLIFAFIGGGRGKEAVENFRAEILNSSTNADIAKRVISLPYQPLDQIKYSLSAADIHIVSMGDSMIGIVHPCKIYSAMLLAKPVLLIGSKDSAMGRLIEEHQCGWQVDHGNVNAMRDILHEIASLPLDRIHEIGQNGRRAALMNYSTNTLSSRVAQIAVGVAEKNYN